MNLPRLELGPNDSPFDEAVITVNGREEETITVACTDSRELARAIVELVNARRLGQPPADEAQTPYLAGVPHA